MNTSSQEPPAGTIGNTISSGSMATSTTTGRSFADSAFSNVGDTSSGVVARKPCQPIASASLT